jgi:putative ABC transport system permease protein
LCRSPRATPCAIGPNVVVVNESASKLLFNGQNPLGHTLEISTVFDRARGRLGGEVIGVVKDVHDVSPGTPPRPTIYLSHAQFPSTDMAVVIRVAEGIDPLSLVKTAKGQLGELDPGLPMTDVRTMNDVAQVSVSQSRFAMLLLTSFALVAVVLAAVGIFGVMSFMVGQRTREIGVRMALGASRGAVVSETLRRTMIPVVIGVAAGLVGALTLDRTMTRLLFDVRPNDPTILGAVAVGLTIIAFGSAWLPARRASRVDPVVALRDE